MERTEIVSLYKNARKGVARSNLVFVRGVVRRAVCVDCFALCAFAVRKNRRGRRNVRVGTRRIYGRRAVF